MKELIVELTNKCCNRCLHCSSIYPKEKYIYLPIDIISQFNFIEKCHFPHVIFSGGEPTIHPYLAQFAQFFSSKGIHTRLYTSGVFQNLDLDTLSYIDSFTISIYSHKEDIHNLITQNQNSFKETMRTFDVLTKLKKLFEVNIVIMKYNIDHIMSTCKFLINKNPFIRINILKLARQGNAELNWLYLQPSLYEVNQLLFKLKNQFTNIKIGHSFNIDNTGYCEAGTSKICITYDGYVIPCEVFKGRRRFFPNLYEEPFKNIFYNYYIDKYKIQKTCISSLDNFLQKEDMEDCHVNC